MVNLGVIGCGHWGPNHVRNFSLLPDSHVKMVSDLDQGRLDYIKSIYKETSTTKNYKDILTDKEISAVVVCTPTKTHYEIVKEALEAGKHVLCEKPLCTNIDEGNELRDLAKKNGLALMVGHVFLFNSGILKLKQLLDDRSLGSLYYLAAVRTNLGPVRQDVNASFDLATHDISIFNYLLKSVPTEVSAVGMCYLNKNIEDVAFINLKYPNGVVGNIRVSWLDPHKVRQITVVGDSKMATWDDLGDIGPVTIFDKGIVKGPQYYNDYGEFQLLAREGDVTIPKVKMDEPLRMQDKEFLDCVQGKKSVISDAEFSLGIVKVLDAIEKSMKKGGSPISVEVK